MVNPTPLGQRIGLGPPLEPDPFSMRSWMLDSGIRLGGKHHTRHQ
ncbi:hypothetical protein MMEU_1819 [Mycobacterium marinum str. Europe]|nr:hypothetical protein MMEU_1819 [Mycobacterium marinum str. Europe]